MDYKTIVVHIDWSKRRAERLALAFKLAEAFGAHVIGRFAISAQTYSSYALAEAGAVAILEATKRYTEALREAEANFRNEMAAHPKVSAEWRESEWDAYVAVTATTRYADLALAGQYDPDDDGGVVRGFLDDLVTTAGKPVLVVPAVGHFPEVGRRALVAWNGSSQAARAVSDALPLLVRAEAVKVTIFDAKDSHVPLDEIPQDELKAWLSRHGVKVSVVKLPARDIDVGSEILSRAADFSADLIVMGAYGHMRLRERVLGGATRAMLKTMTVPVLMSH
jgi:nucleotide-binding universal stress UspA family protein